MIVYTDLLGHIFVMWIRLPTFREKIFIMLIGANIRTSSTLFSQEGNVEKEF